MSQSFDPCRRSGRLHFRRVRAAPALLLLMGVVVLATGCRDQVEGSGQSMTEQRDVEPFTELSVRGAVQAQVRIGQPQSVSLIGDDNVIRVIKTEVRDDRLAVEPEKSYNSNLPLRLEIVVPDLDWVAVSGASTVQVSGSAGEVDAEASGASRTRLQDLSAREAEVDATGASTIEVTVSERLTGSASGASTVTYAGDPDVRVSTSGGSNVRRR